MNVHRLVGAEIHAERLVVLASATTVCATFNGAKVSHVNRRTCFTRNA